VPKGWLKNALGLVQGPANEYGRGADGKSVMASAFQAAFQAQVILFGYRLDLDLNDEAKAAFRNLATFVARWPVILFGPAGTKDAYDWRHAGEYAMVVGTFQPAGMPVYFDSGGALYQANYGSLPPLPDDRSFRLHGESRPIDAVATGFVDNIVPALSMAVDLGADGAAAAYARAASAVQWPGGGAYQFAILPKGRYYREAAPTSAARGRQ
jgi:hypothetical protein